MAPDGETGENTDLPPAKIFLRHASKMATLRQGGSIQTRKTLQQIHGGKLMMIYDITVPISAETPIYKGDPGVEISSFKSIADGATANVSHISMGAHTATHV